MFNFIDEELKANKKLLIKNIQKKKINGVGMQLKYPYEQGFSPLHYGLFKVSIVFICINV